MKLSYLQPSRRLRPDQTMIVGNILDPDAVSEAVCGCDAVYHLAATADINKAVDRPRQAVEVNIVGTVNMLESVVEHKSGSFYRTTKQACENLIHDFHEPTFWRGFHGAALRFALWSSC